MNIEEKYNKLFKYCYMRVKDTYVAEDITQETFLKFFETHKYKDIGKEMAYLYTIARNLCNDFFREKQSVELDDNIPDISHTNKYSYINEALEKLNKEDREILFLRYTNEESISDIARYYSVSRFVINRKLKKALKNLKEVYGNER